MPIYVAPFGVVLGLAVMAYGVLRPRSEFADDRHRSWWRIGSPVVNGIAFLPVPLARAVWVALGALIIVGAVASVV